MKASERFYITKSVEETRRIGQEMGKRLIPGSVLLLSGDLGSGKTVFVQGLARGMNVPPDCYVNSPTYALINEYPARLPFFHADLFRLEADADLEDIGLLELFTTPNVVAIEWPDRLHSSEIPENYCNIFFTEKSEYIRTLQIIAYGLKMIDLIEGMPEIAGSL